jgi:hypothetical protein
MGIERIRRREKKNETYRAEIVLTYFGILLVGGLVVGGDDGEDLEI